MGAWDGNLYRKVILRFLATVQVILSISIFVSLPFGDSYSKEDPFTGWINNGITLNSVVLISAITNMIAGTFIWMVSHVKTSKSNLVMCVFEVVNVLAVVVSSFKSIIFGIDMIWHQAPMQAPHLLCGVLETVVFLAALR